MEHGFVYSRQFTVTSRLGLHLRPAGMIAKAMWGFDSQALISCRGTIADTRSPLSIMALGAAYGAEVDVTVSGPDAAAAFATLEDLFERGFGEVSDAKALPAPVVV